MAVPSLRTDDYTIAWIAVLEVEADAALNTLDKVHEGHFDTGPGDDYIYIGGELHGHNVIIATLPEGHNYGGGAAASLVNQMKLRFSNLRFALLVGVAAGLPRLVASNAGPVRDIRMGDVLVCVPEKACSGIIHYDLGSDTGTGFVQNGRQAETPAIIRSAIRQIRLRNKRAFRRANSYAHYLEILQTKINDPSFQCPSQAVDRLFSTPPNGSRHVPVLIERPLRDEAERTLMRNSKRRDELRDEFDLIGLEMEAAGVMNTLPTGVIRGVCDYGDDQKNKDWQPYAAAVAAVYAKGVLSYISSRALPPRQGKSSSCYT
jgi:nucleoside phosphorylase